MCSTLETIIGQKSWMIFLFLIIIDAMCTILCSELSARARNTLINAHANVSSGTGDLNLGPNPYLPLNFVLTSRKGSGPEVIKLFSYSTQLSTKFILLINVRMPTIY